MKKLLIISTTGIEKIQFNSVDSQLICKNTAQYIVQWTDVYPNEWKRRRTGILKIVLNIKKKRGEILHT